MNTTIQMTYLTEGGRAQQRGSFPLKRRKPEEVAYEWLKQIKRQVSYRELISVIVDGKDDITEKVLDMEKASLD